MKLTRRALLAGGLFSTVSQFPFVRSAIAQDLARPAIVLVCGVKPASDTAALRDGLTRLIDSGIPVAVAIDPFDESGAPMKADADVAVSLRDFAELHPRMVEVCGDLGAVAAGAPLEQIRRASDVQTALVAFMNPGDGSSPRPPVTATAVITSTRPASAEDFRTMRAAGMRIAFHRPGDEAAEEDDT